MLEQTRAKKGIKKADVSRIVHKSKESKEIEELLSSGMKNVGKTFPGIEIVHFCANDDELCKNKWHDYHFDQKIGAVVFWHFIVPIIQRTMKFIGCEYLYLFAADLTEDEHLVNYYREYMNFQVEEEHGAAIPLYDFACKFMCQKTCELDDARNRFFASFNHNENVV